MNFPLFGGQELFSVRVFSSALSSLLFGLSYNFFKKSIDKLKPMCYNKGTEKERNPTKMEKTISDNQLRALQKIRGDWGDVKPYTRVERDKKKYSRKQKHKKGWDE